MVSLSKSSNKKKSIKLKHCIFPDKKRCSKKFINSHTIQNNRVLSALAKDGMVMMMTFNNENGEIETTLKGRKIATTINAFCKYHDSEIFAPIERRSYQNTPEQNFLFAYRSFAYEYHKKLESKQLLEQIRISNDSYFFQLVQKGVEKSLLVDFSRYKEHFDSHLLAKNYDALCTESFIIPIKIKIAATFSIALEYDFDGKLLNDLADLSTELKYLFCSIAPDGNTNQSYLIFSCIKKDEEVYQNFFETLKNSDQNDLLNIATNLVILYCENFVLAPDKIDEFTKKQKDELLLLFKFGTFYEKNTFPIHPKKDLKIRRSFNLFI